MFGVKVSVPTGLYKLGNKFNKALKRGIFITAQKIENQAKLNIFYKDPERKGKTGNLKRSIKAFKINGGLGAIIGSRKPTEYGRIQEFGGVIKAKNKKYLAFKYKGKFVKVKKVKIPAKLYLTRAKNQEVKNMSKYILNELRLLKNKK